LVGNDIANDVGWHTYTIDLWDTFAGSAEGQAGECSGLPLNWKQSSSVIRMRFDPNENITNHSFYNEVDWIRLTKPNAITKGQVYELGLNKFSPNDSFDVDLFYTTNVNDPDQHAVVLYTPPPAAPSLPSGPYTIFLPGIMNGIADSFGLEADLKYQWDTASVTPGEYYICAQVSDNYNSGTFCSEATITIK
jgi:hypothetical protein